MPQDDLTGAAGDLGNFRYEACRLEFGGHAVEEGPSKSTDKNKKARTLLSQHPGHKPGNDLLSRDLTSYYHWLRGA